MKIMRIVLAILLLLTASALMPAVNRVVGKAIQKAQNVVLIQQSLQFDAAWDGLLTKANQQIKLRNQAIEQRDRDIKQLKHQLEVAIHMRTAAL